MDFKSLWAEIKPYRYDKQETTFRDIRAAKYDALALEVPMGFSMMGGALAAATIILLLGIFGFISWGWIPLYLILVMVVGAYTALLRNHTVSRNRFYYTGNHIRWGLHSIFLAIIIPLLPLIRMVFSERTGNVEGTADIDTFAGIGVYLILFCWTGLLFGYIWEALHNLFLGLKFGTHSKQVWEWALALWIQREVEYEESELYEINYDPESQSLRVVGRFSKPDRLRGRLLQLDIIKKVVIKMQDESDEKEEISS